MRLHILIDEETEVKFDRLQKLLKCSKTDVVKRALHLAHQMLQFEMKGGRYITIDPKTIIETDNERTKVFLPSISLQRVIE